MVTQQIATPKVISTDTGARRPYAGDGCHAAMSTPELYRQNGGTINALQEHSMIRG